MMLVLVRSSHSFRKLPQPREGPGVHFIADGFSNIVKGTSFHQQQGVHGTTHSGKVGISNRGMELTCGASTDEAIRREPSPSGSFWRDAGNGMTWRVNMPWKQPRIWLQDHIAPNQHCSTNVRDDTTSKPSHGGSPTQGCKTTSLQIRTVPAMSVMLQIQRHVTEAGQH